MDVFPLQIYSCWIIRMLAALEAFQSFFFIHLRSFCVLLSLMENVFKKTSLTNYEMLLSVSVTRIQQQQRRPPSCLHCTFSHPLSQSTFVSRSSLWPCDCRQQKKSRFDCHRVHMNTNWWQPVVLLFFSRPSRRILEYYDIFALHLSRSIHKSKEKATSKKYNTCRWAVVDGDNTKLNLDSSF